MFSYFVDRADVVVMTVGQQDMCHFQVIFFNIGIQGSGIAVAVDDGCDAIVIGNNIAVCADRTCSVACNFHGDSSLVRSDFIISNYTNPVGNLQQKRRSR